MLLGLLLTGPLAAQQGSEAPSGLMLETVRLYRGDGTTRVKAFVEVPHRLFTRGPDGKLHYTVGVSVRDSAGQALMQEGWQQTAIPLNDVASAASLEILEFEVAPGRYHLGVSVQDSITGTEYRDSLVLEGYRQAPLVSDLVLSRSVRAAKAEDSLPRGGDWRHGNLVITATPYLRLSVIKPELYYLLEAYAGQPDSAEVTSQVLNDSGQVVVQTRPRMLGVDAGGSILTGGVNLTGMPQGEYLFRVTLALDGQQAVREAPFAVRALETPPAVAAGGPGGDDAYFGAMTEAQLDSAQAPLYIIAQPGELNVYDAGMSVQAKARFLTEFWRRLDANPNDGVNLAREAFYARIGEADRLYRESGRSRVQGWRTDRGRIFLRYGTPDETYRRPEEGQTAAVEVWRYTRGRNRYYIFMDRTRLGAYQLLHSNEVTEPGLPDWQSQLGFYGVEAIERFLGVNLGTRGGGPR